MDAEELKVETIDDLRFFNGLDTLMAKALETLMRKFFDKKNQQNRIHLLQPVHVQAAVYIYVKLADQLGLKKYHPMLQLLSFNDFLPIEKLFDIAARLFHLWNVLDEQVADMGCHILAYYVQTYSYTFTQDDIQNIEALPYMSKWFDAVERYPLRPDTSYKTWKEWTLVLKKEYDLIMDNKKKGVSEAFIQNMELEADKAKTRLESAEKREDGWLVEWIMTSLKVDNAKAETWHNVFHKIFYQHNETMLETMLQHTISKKGKKGKKGISKKGISKKGKKR